MIVNALTIDVEDYFQIHAFSNVIKRKDWASFESHVEENTYRILDMLDSPNRPRTMDYGHDHKPRATFFILGWIAERYPQLVKDIHIRGHEVACHGYAHQLIFYQNRDEFREDIKRAKNILEEIVGEEILGYRAPTYSITRETIWALEVLIELGFQYDSSIFPVKHDVYGFPQAPRFPTRITFGNKQAYDLLPMDYDFEESNPSFNITMLSDHSSIIEFPMATWTLFGKNVPVAGGGYFRLFPYFLSRTLLKKINQNEDKPFVFYLHPWEIDNSLPKIRDGSLLSRFRTYININKTENRLKRLISDFSFTRLDELLKTLRMSNEENLG